MLRFITNRLKTCQQGSALIFTLLVFAVLLVLATGIIAVTGTDTRVASAQEENKAALYVAESGVDIVKQAIISGTITGNPGDVFSSSDLSVPGGEYAYEVTFLNGNRVQIDVTGTAKMANGQTAVKNVVVIYKAGGPPPPPSTEVSLSLPSSLPLSVGETRRLAAVVDPPNTGLIWSIADSSIATMDVKENGKEADVTGEAVGTTTITVTTEDGSKSKECRVEVSNSEEPPDKPDTPTPGKSGKAFEHALLGQGKGTGMLQLTGDLKITGPLHSNSDIHINNNGSNAGVEITGPISSTGEIKIIGNGGDFSGVEMSVDDEPIVMPEIDWDYLRTHATQLFDKNTSLDATSVVSPGDIIFVDGNLDLTGEISGNALVVATGDITISGDYNYPTSDSCAVGIIAGNKLRINGAPGKVDWPGTDGPEIRGFIIALNNAIVYDEAKLTGSFIVGNNVECGSGELIVEYIEGEGEDRIGNPVFDVFREFGTDFIANYDELL